MIEIHEGTAERLKVRSREQSVQRKGQGLAPYDKLQRIFRRNTGYFSSQKH